MHPSNPTEPVLPRWLPETNPRKANTEKFKLQHLTNCAMPGPLLRGFVQVIIEESSPAFCVVKHNEKRWMKREGKTKEHAERLTIATKLKKNRAFVGDYRLSTRLSAPRIRPRSSRVRDLDTLVALSSPSSPSIASRCCVFTASRSSRRWAHMRSIREETASAVERYTSMSWTPAAKASSVGARPVVIRERRAETAEGGIGG